MTEPFRGDCRGVAHPARVKGRGAAHPGRVARVASDRGDRGAAHPVCDAHADLGARGAAYPGRGVGDGGDSDEDSDGGFAKAELAKEMQADLFAMEMSIEEAYAGVSGRKRLCKKHAMLRQVTEMQAQLAGSCQQ